MSEKKKVAIVNLITGSRIIGTFLLPLITSIFGPLGTAIYIGALWLTDAVDGYLAKHKWHVSTIFGATLDAFSDKVFGIAGFLYLRTFYPAMIIPALFEVAILGTNIYYGKKGSDVKSSYLGKFKTGVLGVAIAVSILSTISITSGLSLSILPLIGVISVVDAITLGNYVHKNKKYLKTHKPKNDVSHLGFIDTIKEIIRLLKDKKIYSPSYYKEHQGESLLDMLCYEEKQEIIMKEDLPKTENIKTNIEKDDYKFDIQQKNEMKIVYCLNDNEIEKLETFTKNHKIDPNLIMSYLEKYTNEIQPKQISSVTEMQNYIIEEEQEKIKLKGFKEMS